MRGFASKAVRRLSVAAIVATLAIGAGAGPAAAYSTQQTGIVGPYSYSETMATPIAGCGYHDAGYSNWIWLDWVRVQAPTVYAADRNSAKRDSKRVSFQLKIQRTILGSGDPWKVVAESAIQRSSAYEDQAASFSPIKIYFTPKKTIYNGQNAIFRAMVVIKWIKNDGSVEGTVKLWPSFYRLNSPYYSKPYPVSGDEYCSAVNTNG